ncbi:MAG TPA: hypothetical protein VHV30_08235 [Polyangiaceae bacterium]|jgi:hypothetical protein|nr:hypothetical protein [Polyangiaceae bacterium]
MPFAPLAAFAEDVARALGGEAVPLDTRDFASSAVRVGGRCSLLIRDHTYSFALSLPLEGAWNLKAPADWAVAEAEVRRALAAHPPVVSMSDVIARLSWRSGVDFPGTPVPGEAWMRRGGLTVGLLQRPGGVGVAVWAGGVAHERAIEDLGAVDGLPPWIDEKLALQAQAMQAATAQIALEQARRAAFPRPDLAEVIEALRRGQSFQVGGGRCFSTYAMREGQLVVLQFDEGQTTEVRCGEDTLRAATDEAPALFREILDRGSPG